MEVQKIIKFLENFSVITVGENKVPNFGWKQQQTQKLTVQKLTEHLNYNGGRTWLDKDGVTQEVKATTGFGLVTGFEDLEVLDIDLKVFSTAKEQKEFWEEFLGYLRDNILDFEEKFAIYKTKNAGYHILYKTKRCEGNQKLANLRGHKEAVIETRGRFGYVFVYPENKVLEKSYFEIEYISDQDREVLFSFSKMYNYVQEVVLEPKKEKTDFVGGKLTPWEDYNQRNNIFDIISPYFSVVANHSKRYVIKRHGATSAHSGYVFKDTGFMYLFSSGTIFPQEKLITPFIAYTFTNHNGDFTASTKELYAHGFGSRIQKIIQEKQKLLPEYKDEIEEYLITKDDLIFPIDIFPKPFQSYILECNSKLDSNIDFMGSSLIWLISVCIGNSIEIEVKRGWIENCSIWLSLVGKAGIGKTPSINNILFPLLKINQREIKKYYKELEVYEHYAGLTAKEKKDFPVIAKPIKTQFIANDITLEALVDLHQESDNAVGVFKDELAGWLKDMNKYRAGSDLEFWLSVWSGKSVNLNRLTRKGSYVDKPFIPVLGGIQPNILTQFYTDENKDNGFMDRMLISFPEAVIDNYNENELQYEVLDWFKDNIISFYDNLKYCIKRDGEQNIIPLKAVFSLDAKQEWKRIFNEITSYQNSENENEYLKSMYPKQKSYIPRFSLIIHAFDEHFSPGGNVLEISKESVLKAEKLSKYFIATAKKLKLDSVAVNNLKTCIKDVKGKTKFEQFKNIVKMNAKYNKKDVAEILGVSVQMIYKYEKELILV